MDFQPLYSLDDRRAAVERAKPLDVVQASRSCTRCSSRFSARTVCMQPDIIQGDADMGTLLVVGERPSAASDRSGIAHDDDAGEWVRQLVGKSWRGRILYDYAVRCYAPGGLGKKGGGNKKALAETVSACRGYLHGIVREHQPVRVLALGPLAFASLLGRVPPAESVRQSYAYLSDGTPVFLLMPPAVAIRNRFQARWFAEDVAWSCTTPANEPTQWDAEVISVRTRADSELACAQLCAAKWFSFDTETSGVFGDPYFRVLALAVCPGSGDSAFVWDETALLDPEIRAPLLELLADPTVKKAGHNVKYDIMVIATAFGVDVQGLWCDSMLDRSALQADAKVGLDIVAELVGMGGLKRALTKAIQDGVDAIGAARTRAKKLAKTGCREELSLPVLGDPCIEAAVRLIDVEPRRFAYAMVPPKLLTRYVARDAVSTAKIVELQRIGAVGATRETKIEDVDRPKHSLRWSVLRHPADQMLTPAADAYAQIEKWGIAASRPAMLHFNAFLRQGLEQHVRRLDTEGLKNPNSNDQVAAFLFDQRGLTPGDRFGRSAKKAHIEDLIVRYPSEATLLTSIIECRRLAKLLGTYAEGYIVHVRGDGRIHPSFKITGTRTGRPSCEDPNLQNQPRTGTIEGRMSRDCFQVAPGRAMIELDFSQIEIRTAAGLSNDQVMLDAFIAGAASLAAGGKDVDLHWRTVRIICQAAWGIDPATLDLLEAKTKEDKDRRSISKAITFGKMYGKQNRTLARELGISIEAADAIDAAILGGYQGFADWCAKQLALVRKYGEAWSWWQGKRFRRRPLWEVGDSPVGDRPTSRAITAQNSAVNTPIQSTASDFCLASTIEIVDAAKRGHLGTNTQVVLTIHDAVLLECDEDLVSIVVPKAKALMLQWPTPGNVPFGVDAKVGRSFGSMKEYHA